MYTAEISFRLRPGASRQMAESAVWKLMTAMRQNGQLIDRDDSIVPVRGGYKAVVGLPERGSLKPPLLNKHVRDELRALRSAQLKMAAVRVLGEDLDSKPVCPCRKPSAYILAETSHLTREIPLECADCGGVVPLYRIRPTSQHGDYGDIRYWVGRYRALDSLWMLSGVGERFAYCELSRHNSDLSKQGRGICRRIEKNSGTATYYCLYRYFGRSAASERKRPCPSCGRKWLMEPPWKTRYDFRCGRCRLVSNLGAYMR